MWEEELINHGPISLDQQVTIGSLSHQPRQQPQLTATFAPVQNMLSTPFDPTATQLLIILPLDSLIIHHSFRFLSIFIFTFIAIEIKITVYLFYYYQY